MAGFCLVSADREMYQSIVSEVHGLIISDQSALLKRILPLILTNSFFANEQEEAFKKVCAEMLVDNCYQYPLRKCLKIAFPHIEGNEFANTFSE
jgi:hypothetical protein